MPVDQLVDARLEDPRRRRADPQAEAAQHASHAHLDVLALGLQELPRRQQRAGLLRRQRLAVHRLNQPRRISSAMPHASFSSVFTGMVLKAARTWRVSSSAAARAVRLGLARQSGFGEDLARPVHDADARPFQRHVDPGIVLHGRPSMMHGQRPWPTRFHTPSPAGTATRIIPGRPASYAIHQLCQSGMGIVEIEPLRRLLARYGSSGPGPRCHALR
jgi:hypothetical protein